MADVIFDSGQDGARPLRENAKVRDGEKNLYRRVISDPFIIIGNKI